MQNYIEAELRLQPLTKQLCHEIYKNYVADPMMTEHQFIYDKAKTDEYFDSRANSAERKMFAIMLGQKPIGEIQLKRISFEKGEATLSVVLIDDSVKGKGHGTKAQQLIVEYGFNVLCLKKILADTVHRNTRSAHILQKLGFVYTHEDKDFKYYELYNNGYS